MQHVHQDDRRFYSPFWSALPFKDSTISIFCAPPSVVWLDIFRCDPVAYHTAFYFTQFFYPKKMYLFLVKAARQNGKEDEAR